MNNLLKALGNVCAIIGAQWGDEGKGKAIDILTEHFDVIARACGGANAGHTIVVNGKKHVFRLMPSGCLHPVKPVVLGAGMVIHLPTLLEEIDILKAAGVDIVPRLRIASNAHVLFDFHKEIDGVQEERRAAVKGKGIGTTKRGIGPAYMDKAARTGLRMEILGWDEGRIQRELTERVDNVKQMYGVDINVAKELEAVRTVQALLGRNLVNCSHFIDECIQEGKTILIEGAQATLLDIDHGTYPYVTSSATTAAGALQGLGMAPRTLDSCIGVVKAYCTRVGEGAFPTEVLGSIGDRLRERGGEYGSVTGRPRRCGWLYLPDLKHSAIINGFDCWNVTKLDVLDEEDEVLVGTGLDEKGNAVYQRMPGWKTSTRGITEFDKLPPQAREYIAFIEQRTGIKARLVGTGQGREDMIVR